jgi:hypothetical protein
MELSGSLRAPKKVKFANSSFRPNTDGSQREFRNSASQLLEFHENQGYVLKSETPLTDE